MTLHFQLAVPYGLRTTSRELVQGNPQHSDTESENIKQLVELHAIQRYCPIGLQKIAMLSVSVSFSASGSLNGEEHQT